MRLKQPAEKPASVILRIVYIYYAIYTVKLTIAGVCRIVVFFVGVTPSDHRTFMLNIT